MKALVFGASLYCKKLYARIREQYDIVGFCDNDSSKWGKNIEGVHIFSPDEIFSQSWDEIVVASTSIVSIQTQLEKMGIPKSKINIQYMQLQVWAREQFVKDFAEIVYLKKMSGSVAEAGVYQGEFAKVINASFPDRKCYLFDTFEGFSDKDTRFENELFAANIAAGHLGDTTESLVLSKMSFPENCIIRKGFFPETTSGIDDQFCFVNLDMDLYKPTLEGLKFFYHRMVQGGIILIHDFFSEEYQKGIRMAIDEFGNGTSISLIPIGDGLSVAIRVM